MGILDRFRYGRALADMEARAPAFFDLLYQLATSRAQAARAGYGVGSGNPAAPGPLLREALEAHCDTTERVADSLEVETVPAFLDRFRQPLVDALRMQAEATRRYLAGVTTGSFRYDDLKEAESAEANAMDYWGALLPDRLLFVQPARSLPPGLFVAEPGTVPGVKQRTVAELAALRRKLVDSTDRFDVLKPSFALHAWLAWYRDQMAQYAAQQGSAEQVTVRAALLTREARTTLAVALWEEADALNRYIANTAEGRLALGGYGVIGTHVGVRLGIACDWAACTWERSSLVLHRPPGVNAREADARAAQGRGVRLAVMRQRGEDLETWPLFGDPEDLPDDAADRYPPWMAQ
jgi:hypothetical protein